MDTQTYNYKVVRQFRHHDRSLGYCGHVGRCHRCRPICLPRPLIYQMSALGSTSVRLRPLHHQCGDFCVRRLRSDGYIILRCSTYL